MMWKGDRPCTERERQKEERGRKGGRYQTTLLKSSKELSITKLKSTCRDTEGEELNI